MIWAGYLARVEEVRSGIYVFGRETWRKQPARKT
jgi:hypothetical protein